MNYVQVTWLNVPFGPIPGFFLPVSDFKCSAGMKGKGENAKKEDGLQTCEFTLHAARATGMEPRLVFELFDMFKGFSSPLFVTNAYERSGGDILGDFLWELYKKWGFEKYAFKRLRPFPEMYGDSDSGIENFGNKQPLSKTQIFDSATLALGYGLQQGIQLGGAEFVLMGVKYTPVMYDAQGDIVEAKIGLQFKENPKYQVYQGSNSTITFTNKGKSDAKVFEKIIPLELTVTTYSEESKADQLILRFNLKPGAKLEVPVPETISVLYKGVDMGVYYYDHKNLEPDHSGEYKIEAYAVPLGMRIKKYLSFSKTSSVDIAKKIAFDNGLKFDCKIKGKIDNYEQRRMTDMEFLCDLFEKGKGLDKSDLKEGPVDARIRYGVMSIYKRDVAENNRPYIKKGIYDWQIDNIVPFKIANEIDKRSWGAKNEKNEADIKKTVELYWEKLFTLRGAASWPSYVFDIDINTAYWEATISPVDFELYAGAVVNLWSIKGLNSENRFKSKLASLTPVEIYISRCTHKIISGRETTVILFREILSSHSRKKI